MPSEMAGPFFDQLPSAIITDIVERVRQSCPASFRALERTSASFQSTTRSLSRCLRLRSWTVDARMSPELAALVTKKELQLRPLVKHLKILVDFGGHNIQYMKAMGYPPYVETQEDGWTTTSIVWERGFSDSVDGHYPVAFIGAASSTSLRSLELVNWPCLNKVILGMLGSFERLETLVVSGYCNLRHQGPNIFCRSLNMLKDNIELPSLTHLDLINLNHGCRAAVTSVPSQQMLPRVRSLAFSSDIDWINDKQGFSKGPEQLETLHLQTNFLNDDLLGKIAVRFKLLQELRVRHDCYPLPYEEHKSPKVTRAGLQDLMSGCPHLKVLHISEMFVDAISSAEWCSLLQTANQLKEVHLPMVSEGIAEMVKTLGGLEVLSFEDPKHLLSFKELCQSSHEGAHLQVRQNTCPCVGRKSVAGWSGAG